MIYSVASTVISQALLAAAKEMGIKLIRSAYSTVIREARDCSAALLSAEADCIAQSGLIPIHMAGAAQALRACLAQYPGETLSEGDFLLNNDPYSGAQHLPDVYMFTPIFVDGRLIAFSSTVCHHLDLGGGSPGLNATAEDLHGEGLVIPPTKWNLKRDWQGQGSLYRLIQGNIRVPKQTMGDFNAQVAANEVGTERVKQLCAKYGVEQVIAAIADLLGYAEQRMRAAIRQVPNGTYHGEAYLDDDGVSEEALVVRAQLTVMDDSLHVSFEGTSSEVTRNLNSPLTGSLAATMCCVKSVLTSSDVPFNSGAERAVTVDVPKGSLLNPNYPAPVRARMIACYRAYNAVMQAFSRAIPDAVVSAGYDSTTVACLSRKKNTAYQVYIEVFGGGLGASATADGCDAVDSPLSNCANTPVEALDMEYDFFRVTEYALGSDTAGAGLHQGGAGFKRSYEIMDDGVVLSIYGDRFKAGAVGLFGGGSGVSGSCNILRRGETLRMRSKGEMALERGDIVTFFLGGGGGYGDPAKRPLEKIQKDLESGLISEAMARRYPQYVNSLQAA